MHEDLYFLPLLAKALRRRDPRRALADAISRIQAMGGQARYRRGVRQFARLMALAAAAQAENAYRSFVEAPSELQRPSGIQFVLQREGTRIRTWPVEDGPAVQVIGGIVPGAYRMCLDTGRLLWSRHLDADHLVWTRAFPGMPLQAAADTDPGNRQASLVETLLSGTVTVRVYPGLETGWLSVERRAR